jgi:hypothetical protein
VTEPEMYLVLAPVVTIQKLDQSVSQFSGLIFFFLGGICPVLMCVLAGVPAIGDAIEALDDLCSHLSGTIKVITSLTAEIAAKENIRVDNIQDVRSGKGAREYLLIHNTVFLACGCGSLQFLAGYRRLSKAEFGGSRV